MPIVEFHDTHEAESKQETIVASEVLVINVRAEGHACAGK